MYEQLTYIIFEIKSMATEIKRSPVEIKGVSSDEFKTYVYSDVKPKTPKENLSCADFMTSLCKKSGDVNGTKYNHIDNLNEEISSGLAKNKLQVAEEFVFHFPRADPYYHNGYLKYLLTAWLNDCGVEVRPEHIYNIILHQLCKIVNSQSDKFRPVFTKSPEKITIKLDAPTLIIEDLIEELKKHVPLNIDKFVPVFPNAPENFMNSMYGLFGEMVKNYYDCMVYSCSIPKIRLCTDVQKWNIVDQALTDIQAMFAKHGIEEKYLVNCQTKLREMIANLNDKIYWGKFFFLERCGSGSQQNTLGHVMQFLNSDCMILSHELPDMVSRYEFKNTNYPPDQQMQFYISGIMSSDLDPENIMVPKYHCNVLVRDSAKCKLTPSDITDRKEVLECYDILNFYDTSAETSHFDNHLSIKPNQYTEKRDYTKLITSAQGDFETYKKKVSSRDGRGDATLMRDYKGYLVHNKCVIESKGDKDKYFELRNFYRKEELKTKYCFWYVDQSDITDSWNAKRTLTVEKWKQLVVDNKSHEDRLITLIPKLNAYVKNYENREIYEMILKMGNTNVIQAFLNEYKKNPYTIRNLGGWSSYDPIKSYACVDSYESLLLDIIIACSRSQIPPNIKYIILTDIVTNNIEFKEKILNEFTMHVQNRIKQSIDRMEKDMRFKYDVDWKLIPTGITDEGMVAIFKDKFLNIEYKEKTRYSPSYCEQLGHECDQLISISEITKIPIDKYTIIKNIYPDYFHRFLVLNYFFDRMDVLVKNMIAGKIYQLEHGSDHKKLDIKQEQVLAETTKYFNSMNNENLVKLKLEIDMVRLMMNEIGVRVNIFETIQLAFKTNNITISDESVFFKLC
ncbi:MAG: protein of unknown function DUF4419 [Edafosvirus sp.]|uniref:Uncharacterized protein n=1 Tax=Edafosvirus sp. TaxID=2487765 RepID=A0A3G4ZWZ1_9VIRU|nr:MAG: protein of unknown function DUF4419 [Edafosvirus sp.]